ncbi:chloride channel protein [Brenneria goodwinii]|uniref:Chloride channel protein n=1 Tax=Brenneria goodwinii TaxID=1109412 RepID=A0A0G4JY95_9GAMM|nr:chloride channel protein [Brenneria goodwinii]CPR18832.1 Chloride channel protein [Brenneria goodwinii]
MPVQTPHTRTYKLGFALFMTGILAGMGGMLLALLLHKIQHLTYGYSLNAVISNQTFLSGVADASLWRRFLVLLAAGLFAGCGWLLLGRLGKKRVSISAAIKDVSKPMPFLTTIIHSLLQIITVAMGSPLGREVAPREIGAVLAGTAARRLHLSPQETQLLIACGAGAGLAAVYNVPLAGAIFTLEVLLVNFTWEAAIAAIVTSALAAWIATLFLGEEHQYHFPHEVASTSLVFWGILSGPVFGVAAFQFRRLTQRARSKVKNNWQMPVFSILAFTLLGVLSLWFPQLPGNGKGPTQLTLNGDITPSLVIALLCFKVLVIYAVLRGGAEGGLLTPGLTIGALMGTLLFLTLGRFFPGSDMGGFALTGATGFLAASMQMPYTAIVLMMEFTHMDHSFLVPLAFCVTGAFLTSHQLEKGKNG